MGTPPRGSTAYERVFLAIAAVVTAIWAVAQLVQIISPTHVAPQYVNYVMVSVAGSFFGGAVLTGRRRNGKEE